MGALGGPWNAVTPGPVLKWLSIIAVLYFSGTEAETLGFRLRTCSPR